MRKLRGIKRLLRHCARKDFNFDFKLGQMSWYYFSKQRKYSKGNILNDKFLTFHLISSSKILFCRYYFYFKDFSFFLFRAKIWLPFERQYEFDTDKFIRFFFLFLNRWAQKLYIENTWSMLKNFKYRKNDHNQSYFYHENVTKIHNDKDNAHTHYLSQFFSN